MKRIPESHLDHGLSDAVVAFLMKRFANRTGFFIETVELPKELGTVPCGLHGPAMGQDPVHESEVFYARRGDRKGESRLCRRPIRHVRKVTVIAGPHGDDPCVLFTAFGGPLAPKEPWETEGTPEHAESVAFWQQHALVDPTYDR